MESNEAFVVGGVATVVGLGSILVGSTRLGNLAMGLCGLAAILLANDPGGKVREAKLVVSRGLGFATQSDCRMYGPVILCSDSTYNIRSGQRYMYADSEGNIGAVLAPDAGDSTPMAWKIEHQATPGEFKLVCPTTGRRVHLQGSQLVLTGAIEAVWRLVPSGPSYHLILATDSTLSLSSDFTTTRTTPDSMVISRSQRVAQKPHLRVGLKNPSGLAQFDHGRARRGEHK